MTTVQTPADRLSSAAALSGISSKLQKNLFFLVLVILGNSVATLMLIGGTFVDSHSAAAGERGVIRLGAEPMTGG